MPINRQEDKRFEAETLAYKQFMRIAKKIKWLEYGKWDIVPDISDPLRKFTLEKKSEWFTVKLAICMEQYYHRGDYTQDRYDYRALIQVGGMMMDTANNRELYINTNIRLKPRMAKKLVACVNEVVIPKFYLEVSKENEQRQAISVEQQKYKQNIAKVIGMKEVKSPKSWESHKYGQLTNCPFNIELDQETVSVHAVMSYDMLAKLAEVNGWGK